MTGPGGFEGRSLPPCVDGLLRELYSIAGAMHREQRWPVTADRISEICDDLRAAIESADLFEQVR